MPPENESRSKMNAEDSSQLCLAIPDCPILGPHSKKALVSNIVFSNSGVFNILVSWLLKKTLASLGMEDTALGCLALSRIPFALLKTIRLYF